MGPCTGYYWILLSCTKINNYYDYDYDRIQGRGTACLPDQNTYYLNKSKSEVDK